MASTNTVATLDGLYKAVYGKNGPVNLIPDNAVLQELVPFEKSERTGKSYQVPVVLTSESGFAYGLADETITLATDVAATLKNLEVKGAQIVGQASINYDAASRSVGSQAAFQSAAGLVVQNLFESASHRLEASLLYGSAGIATVDSLSSQDIVLTAASFADGLWMGKEGALIDVYQSNGTLRQGDLTISAINPDTYTITVTGTTTGIVATDVVFFDGSYGKECYGLDSIMTNTGSMFGISAASYALWKANTYSAGSAALTMAKVLSAASKAVSKGGLNGEAVCLVHPSSWNNLNSNESALRVHGQESKATNGFDAIEYRYAAGKIKMVAHPMVKRGEAFIFNPKDLKRVGSQDISSMTPGKDNEEIFIHSQTLSAYMLRVYSNQAIISMKPAAMCKITSIVPA